MVGRVSALLPYSVKYFAVSLLVFISHSPSTRPHPHPRFRCSCPPALPLLYSIAFLVHNCQTTQVSLYTNGRLLYFPSTELRIRVSSSMRSLLSRLWSGYTTIFLTSVCSYEICIRHTLRFFVRIDFHPSRSVISQSMISCEGSVSIMVSTLYRTRRPCRTTSVDLDSAG